MKLFTLTLAFAAGLLLAPAPSTCLAGDCGYKPIKPIPPIGCKDVQAECVCDAEGNKCAWQWRCIE